MIYDKLSNIKNYKGLFPNLDDAIDYILSHDLNGLPLGKTVINGDRLYVNVMECDTAMMADKKYEVHQEYLDIQIDLRGAERLITGDSATMQMGDYDKDSDYCPAACDPLADCIIGPDNFVICMIGEPHMPGVSLKEPKQIKKCVFKVHR